MQVRQGNNKPLQSTLHSFQRPIPLVTCIQRRMQAQLSCLSLPTHSLTDYAHPTFLVSQYSIQKRTSLRIHYRPVLFSQHSLYTFVHAKPSFLGATNSTILLLQGFLYYCQFHCFTLTPHIGHLAAICYPVVIQTPATPDPSCF